MDDLPDLAEVRGIIHDLEEQANEKLAQFHRIEGALETWRGIQKSMTITAMAARGKKAQE